MELQQIKEFFYSLKKGDMYVYRGSDKAHTTRKLRIFVKVENEGESNIGVRVVNNDHVPSPDGSYILDTISYYSGDIVEKL